MERIRLGRTGLEVCADGFGALPIQRMSMPDAAALLRRARAVGIDFFDTPRAYTDSEAKLKAAFEGNWDGIVLASKTMAKNVADFWRELDKSLAELGRDHIDLYQFHMPQQCYKPGDGTGMYEAMLEAKAQGKIRFIGMTAHRLDRAQQCIDSGLYDTLQFPFSYLSGPQEEALVAGCKAQDMGFIAMKALSGGLITDIAAARAYMGRFDNVVPIWGLQRESELDALLADRAAGRASGPEVEKRIAADRAELGGAFCRGCGYCMPCPVGIEISMCARIMLFSRRASMDMFTPEWQHKMAQTRNCIECGECAKACPYDLGPPALMQKNYTEYVAELGFEPKVP